MPKGKPHSAGPRARSALGALRGAKAVYGPVVPVCVAVRDEASRWLQFFGCGRSRRNQRGLLTCGFVAGAWANTLRTAKKLQPSGFVLPGGAMMGRRTPVELLSGRRVKLSPSVPSKWGGRNGEQESGDA